MSQILSYSDVTIDPAVLDSIWSRVQRPSRLRRWEPVVYGVIRPAAPAAAIDCVAADEDPERWDGLS